MSSKMGNHYTKITSLVTQLKTEMDKIEKIDPDSKFYSTVCSLLDNLNDKDLVTVYKAKIKFVSSLALNRIIRRKIPLDK